MNSEHAIKEELRALGVADETLLGRLVAWAEKEQSALVRRDWGESCDNPPISFLGDINNVGNQLAIMARGIGGVSFTVESLKDESVRLNISDIRDADAECLDNNVVILRGRTGQLFYSLFKRFKSGIGAH